MMARNHTPHIQFSESEIKESESGGVRLRKENLDIDFNLRSGSQAKRVRGSVKIHISYMHTT